MTLDEIKYYKRRLSGYIVEFNRDAAMDKNGAPRKTESILNLLIQAEAELYIMEAEAEMSANN